MRLREFPAIFGASTAASAAVLAIFIGGLGAGGLVLGSRTDRHPRPIRLYAQLEAIVALSAAASPLLLSLVRTLYVAAGGTTRLGLGGGTAGRLVLSALVLALPTVAMGGTLPAVAFGVTRQSDVGRRDVAVLYSSALRRRRRLPGGDVFSARTLRHSRHAVDRRGDQSARGVVAGLVVRAAPDTAG
jgi:hypothetical protein